MRLALHVGCNWQANVIRLIPKRLSGLQSARNFGLNAHFEPKAMTRDGL